MLSAKYGFIAPDFIIPGPYEVTFKRRATGPISMDRLREQVHEQQLGRFRTIVGLGGKEYCAAVETAFADQPVRFAFPFTGLVYGKMVQATNRAVDSNEPRFHIIQARHGQSI